MSGVLNSKGQTTVEFLVVFLLMLSMYQLIILPSANLSVQSALAVEKSVKAKIELAKLETAIDYASRLPGEAAITVTLYLEEGIKIGCVANNPATPEDETGISFEVSTAVDPENEQEDISDLLKNEDLCPGEKCSSSLRISGSSFSCNFSTINGAITPKSEIQLNKTLDGIVYAAQNLQ